MAEERCLIDYYRRTKVVLLYPDGHFLVRPRSSSQVPCGFAWRFHPLPAFKTSVAAIYVKERKAVLFLRGVEYEIGDRVRTQLLVRHRPFLGSASLIMDGNVVSVVKYLRVFESTVGALDFTRDSLGEILDDFFYGSRDDCSYRSGPIRLSSNGFRDWL